jgi:Spy/CpxP family protein refolding chaperone
LIEGFEENLMKIRTALIAAAFLVGPPLLAQTAAAPATPAPAKPPVHQPGVAAHPSTTTNSQSAAADADKVDPAKDAAIRHLMDLTQTSKMGDDINAYITTG